MRNDNHILQVEKLTKTYPINKNSSIVAVNNISFHIKKCETLGLVGESGSGKTTVGRCVLRLIEPDSGKIIFSNIDISTISDKDLRSLRQKATIVFQDSGESLNPVHTVFQIIEEPLIIKRIDNKNRRREIVLSTIKSVQLEEHHLYKVPRELTTSEQQRVGIARAIVTQPELIVVDEATSNLGPKSRADLLSLFNELQEKYSVSYLFISHDVTAVRKISHRIAIMYLGKIVELAPTAKIFARQYHPYTRGLLSSILYPDPNEKLKPFILKGEIPTAINPPDRCPLIGRCPFVKEKCFLTFPSFEEIEEDHFVACYRSRELFND